MVNPIHTVLQRRQSFVYFHTREITRPILDAALTAGKSLEIDLSVGEEGAVVVGHPWSYYTFRGLPSPRNLPLDYVLKEALAGGLFVVLDCKDIHALPVVEEIIGMFGVDRCMVHVWTDALLFKPYPPELVIEPHWHFEDLPLSALRELKHTTGVPMVLSCRGLTLTRLQEYPDQIFDAISQAARGTAEAVNLNLPDNAVPPEACAALQQEGILPMINVDRVPPATRPAVYVGSTDDLQHASDPG